MNAKLIKAHKLDKIKSLNSGQCYDAAQILRYLLGRTTEDWEIQEIENYLNQVEARLGQIKVKQ